MDEYTRTNLANWESRVPVHTGPQGYDLARYLDDPAALSSVVASDAPYLGDLTRQRVVHLQCHIGTDTLSLARLGADVTGVDFSPEALAAARRLAGRAGPDVRYVQATVDEVPARLPETFDLAYTGVGALNWLPSAQRWARIVGGLLRPGGRLYLREGHPMLYEWNHGLAEVVQAVLDAGLQLTRLEELRELEWPFFDWMEPTERGGFVLPEAPERLPSMYRLEAIKR